MRQTCQMVCPVEILARGCPLCRSFSKIEPQLAETELGFLGCRNEKGIFLAKTCSNSIKDLSAHLPWIGQQFSAPYWMR